MITSASGWRKVFAVSGDEEDTTTEISADDTVLSALAADTFAHYMLEKKSDSKPVVIVGTDARPTGASIADAMLRALLANGIAVQYAGIIAAPEIMAYARDFDGFVYISASHNPVGHNGIKFGLNDGGVLDRDENAKLVAAFEERCADAKAVQNGIAIMERCDEAALDWVYAEQHAVKQQSVSAYRSFEKRTISAACDIASQNALFSQIRASVKKNPLGVVCDMNGSARTLSIDEAFLADCGINFYAINNQPGKIAHTIIPEPENLVYCARKMNKLHKDGVTDALLGYMPDCDGDRGNIVYWNEVTGKAEVLKAQEVFALSVLSELAYATYKNGGLPAHGLLAKAIQTKNDENDPDEQRLGVAVNCPTSMRIEEIAAAFGAHVFRAEVGEANVVNLAREKREENYIVPILGEGSNGGNITHPAAVRDPMNTLFALIKLLVLRDVGDRKGLFHLWCEASCQLDKYKDDFTLSDVIATLPVYTTTGVSEKRAILHINTQNHAVLKRRFQKVFEDEWQKKRVNLLKKYGFCSYEAIATNGTKETHGIEDFGISGKGGLKILFYNEKTQPLAFIWMRGSGTEPVFRIMCDVKGSDTKMERELLKWETEMLATADQE
ncbi:MAG: phosphoglucomutase [Treponema sp.]|nr:phosphoglucomutase [Treponema sp.]